VIEESNHSAERWAILIETRELNPAEQAELDLWLKEDPRREGSLLRAQAALSYLDRGRALGGRLPKAPSNRRYILAALGTGLVAASLGGLYVFTEAAQSITTKIGEVRQVPLEDGSTATINTNSRLEVKFKPEQRNLTLNQGEVWFRVAHNKTRPFIVSAGDVRVRAVGTAFSVRRYEASIEILVTEGVVEAWLEGRESQKVRVSAGAKAEIGKSINLSEAKSASTDIDRALAWRTGELALDGETLGYAVAELNRYNTTQIVIDNPELARETVVGYFRTTEPENFSRTIAPMLGGYVEKDTDIIRIKK
jgi:transmembrane sensor